MTESEPTSIPSWWRTSPALLVLVGVVVAGLIAGLVVVFTGFGDDEKRPSQAGAVVVARQAALEFFTLDYRDPEKSITSLLAISTGSFKAEYSSRQAQLVEQITKEKVLTEASVPDLGVAVEFFAGNDARVLVSIDVVQPSGVKVFPMPRNRVRVVLQRAGDRWLVSEVNQVG